MEQYKEATLFVPNEGASAWFVIWYNFNPATQCLERVRKTFKLNRIADLKLRREKGLVICAIINRLLRNGYNIFTYKSAAAESAQQPEQSAIAAPKKRTEVVSLEVAINRALRKRVLGKEERTVQTYRSFVKVFTSWASEMQLNTMPVAEFTDELFNDYLYYKNELGHGNRNLNDHLNFFKTTFDFIRKMKMIQVNPLTDLEYLTENESTLFESLTEEEVQRIVPVLINYSPRYYMYTKFIPYEMIRPRHIARLQSSQFNYQKGWINLTPETTKNKKVTRKELLPDMRNALIDMDYHTIPGNWYLFGKNFEPSPDLYPRLSITAAEVWRKLVIDGLGINKKMYALKATSSQYIANENEKFDLKALQHHMEHHSMAMTEIYLQGKVVKKLPKGTKLLRY